MIAHKGEAATEAWLKGVKANLAHKPAGGDREQARDIFSGKCDLALGNTYYMALMMKNEKNPEQQQWAGAIKILFPNAADRGSHVNISGMAMAKHAPNKANALKLMEFLASEEAQKIYATANNEYPVNSSVPASDIVRSWGTLKADALPLENIAKYRKKASELVDKANFDAGPSSWGSDGVRPSCAVGDRGKGRALGSDPLTPDPFAPHGPDEQHAQAHPLHVAVAG